jgi:hypothetical protein
MTTAYHAKYFAHALTREGGEGVDRLARSLFDACVDLNPHQIESAIFAMRSHLVKGVLLAVEDKLPGQKIGKRWRFHKDAIDAWVTHGLEKSKDEPQE